MKYVKYFDIVGVDTAQIPCIELQGAPNAATVGAVGLLGMDMTSTSHDLYKCVKVEGSVYTWEKVVCGKDGVNIVKAEINDLGELVLTLSDGNTINAGKVKGADGKDGTNGTNGKDGCEITNITISDKNELLVETSDGKVINAGVLPTVKGDAGVSVVKAEFNNKGELVLTLSSGELLTVGHAIPTLQDWLGTNPIGSDTHYIYYDGEKFVERPVSIKDETTEWAQIALMADKISKGEKTPEELGLAVGQERTITLTTGEEVTFVILGFNHDDLADGSGKAGITFGMKNLLATKYPIAPDANYTWSDWSDSFLKGEVLLNAYQSLPNELRDVIKSVTKKYSTSESDVCDNFLFLLSNTEVGGSASNSVGTKYAYYTGRTGWQDKYLANGVGAMSPWWIRENMIKTGTTHRGYYIKSGSVSSNVSNDITFTAGICFGFCI